MQAWALQLPAEHLTDVIRQLSRCGTMENPRNFFFLGVV